MKKILYVAVLLSFSLLMPGCLEETFPTERASDEQVQSSDSALEALASGMVAYLNAYGSYSAGDGQDFGYPARMMMRSVMGQDMPVDNMNYDYFNWPYGTVMYLGNYTFQIVIWQYYYKQIVACNSVLRNIELSDPSISQTAKHIYGQALALRAMCYYELSEIYEYKLSGTDADQTAQSDGVLGLTVPIVTENTTEKESFNNPRAPFYKMYRFILTDLNLAAELLKDYNRPRKNRPNANFAQGLLARVWLELGTRFRLTPEDMQIALSHENDEDLAMLDKFGITTARDCYMKASDCANDAKQGLTPLTRDQWHNATSGFNNSESQNSWIMAVMIGPDAVNNAYVSFMGQMSAETEFGVSNLSYGAIRKISNSLYDQIPEADWRKTTWIDPADAGNAPDRQKYSVLVMDDSFKSFPAYTGLKFRPGQGNMSDSKTGNAVDIPMMRVEEMYLIEAEATACVEGVVAGKAVLEAFLNTYRYTDGSYVCTANNLEEFIREVLVQKRIEFWGEGIGSLDFKRLKLGIRRGFSGTNYLPGQRYNSPEGFAPLWMNVYISDFEFVRNGAVIKNPDPSSSATGLLWSE